MTSASIAPVALGEVDLLTWVPPAGALEHTSVRDFKRTLRDQGLDLTDAPTRRALIQRWSVGGWMERPYGADHEIADLRHTLHRTSAQVRSRCLNVLWTAEQADAQAPLMDATTDMANHAMALLWTEDLKDTVRTYQDIRDMMQCAYECTVLPRSQHLGDEQARLERSWAGLALLHQAHADGLMPDPTMLAALLLRREGRHTMMQPGPDGVRLVWSWLDWLMKDEKPLGPGTKTWSCSPARQVLDHVGAGVMKADRQAWLSQLPHQALDPVLDAPLPDRLSQWVARCYPSDARRDTVQHLQATFALRCQAQDRADQAWQGVPPARARLRRRS